jgi:hypothetical protein
MRRQTSLTEHIYKAQMKQKAYIQSMLLKIKKKIKTQNMHSAGQKD